MKPSGSRAGWCRRSPQRHLLKQPRSQWPARASGLRLLDILVGELRRWSGWLLGEIRHWRAVSLDAALIGFCLRRLDPRVLGRCLRIGKNLGASLVDRLLVHRGYARSIGRQRCGIALRHPHVALAFRKRRLRLGADGIGLVGLRCVDAFDDVPFGFGLCRTARVQP